MKPLYEISEKLPNMTNFSKILHHFEIRLHLPISFFPAKCNLNRGNLIGPRTVFYVELTVISKISHSLERILLEQVDKKSSLDSQLQSWYKPTLYFPLELVLENEISSKNLSSLIRIHL